MTFRIYSYLATILIFAGTAVLIEFLVGRGKLKKYKKLIGLIVTIGLLGTLVAEPIALRWRTWFYAQDKTFGIYVFGAALETLIYVVFVAIAISWATLAWSDFEEEGKSLIKGTIEEFESKLKEWRK